MNMKKNIILKEMVPYLMLAPALIIILIFKIYPIISVILESFSEMAVHLCVPMRFFWRQKFLGSFRYNGENESGHDPASDCDLLCLALLVNSTIKGIGIFRSIYYLPVTMAISVASISWNLMANYNSGVFNSISTFLGLGKQGFFTDVKQALWCIVMMATWKGCGYWMMYILAGLKGVDTSIYESAKLDGAGFFTTLFHITLPLIKRTLLFCICSKYFCKYAVICSMKLITEGGPQNSTNVLMYEVYKSAFRNGNASRAGALTTILLLIVLAVVVIQFRLLNEKEE